MLGSATVGVVVGIVPAVTAAVVLDHCEGCECRYI